jgi:hypothetical protein
MVASAAMAGIYFIVLPVVWLGVLGPEQLGKDLALVLRPTFAPLLGSFGKAAAIWFIMLNMLHGTMQPLAGAARTLSQLSEDGLLPRFLAWRSTTDCPWAATLLTATAAVIFLIIGDPIWLIAAANFTYLISVCMPNVAAWLLRRDLPDAARPYRAPRGMIVLGLAASAIWLLSAVLGFQQFGLPTVLFGLALAYSGAALYVWRLIEDRLREGLPVMAHTLHTKLTGAMLFVLVLDGAGYFMAVSSVTDGHRALMAALEDIFVVVALLTITVGLVLPGMITHTATEVSEAAKRLTSGMLREFSHAMAALGHGELDAACFGQHRTDQDSLSRRTRRNGGKLQHPPGGGEGGGARARRSARKDAHGARRAIGETRADRPSRPSRHLDGSTEPHRSRGPSCGDFRSRQGKRQELRSPDHRSRSFQRGQRCLRARGRR